jgi:hypothetical protein
MTKSRKKTYLQCHQQLTPHRGSRDPCMLSPSSGQKSRTPSYLIFLDFNLDCLLPNTFQTLFLLLEPRFISILSVPKIFRIYSLPPKKLSYKSTDSNWPPDVRRRQYAGKHFSFGLPVHFSGTICQSRGSPERFSSGEHRLCLAGGPTRLWRDVCRGYSAVRFPDRVVWLVGDDRDGTVTEISTEVLIFLW